MPKLRRLSLPCQASKCIFPTWFYLKHLKLSQNVIFPPLMASRQSFTSVKCKEIWSKLESQQAVECHLPFYTKAGVLFLCVLIENLFKILKCQTLKYDHTSFSWSKFKDQLQWKSCFWCYCDIFMTYFKKINLKIAFLSYSNCCASLSC